MATEGGRRKALPIPSEQHHPSSQSDAQLNTSQPPPPPPHSHPSHNNNNYNNPSQHPNHYPHFQPHQYPHQLQSNSNQNPNSNPSDPNFGPPPPPPHMNRMRSPPPPPNMNMMRPPFLPPPPRYYIKHFGALSLYILCRAKRQHLHRIQFVYCGLLFTFFVCPFLYSSAHRTGGIQHTKKEGGGSN